MREYSIYRAALVYIEECPPEEIGRLTVNDIAGKFNVNRSFLSRSFMKHDVLTAKKYLDFFTVLRFESVVRKLKNPTLKEVLEIMNINNSSHFIKRYKKERGHTPGQFCKEWREKRKEWRRKPSRKKGRK